MKVEFANIVMFTENVSQLAQWYMAVFDQTAKGNIETEKYVELEQDGNVIFAIADKDYMSYAFAEENRNTAVPQVAVSSIKELESKIEKHGGSWKFGPSVEGDNFHYGGILDPDDNLIWVFENSNINPAAK